MSKLLPTLAAVGFIGLMALLAPASAAERRADGLHNADQVDVSAAKRKKRRVVVREYYGEPYYYGGPYYDGYYAYGARPYGYYRPGPHIHIGPFGFGFGF